MTSDDLHATMERVGAHFDLGDYEIDAYLTVLEQGELTAGEIAEWTDIPQPRVYDTVRSLADRGLVEVRESRPMKVVAIDPEEAYSTLQSTMLELVTGLEERYTAPARNTEAASLVKSRSTILRYLVDVIETAEYELALALTPALLERFEEELRAAIDDGVSIELIVAPASEAPSPESFDYERVATTARARRGITTPVVAVADGVHSIYTTQDALGNDRDRYGVIFNRSELGFLVSGFFGTVLWTTTQHVLLGDGSDRPLPRRYASIRRCVKDLRDIGGEFYATVEGRDVETGRSRVVRGKVVDVEFAETEEVASFSVESAEDVVRIGGRVASYEDMEAHEIVVGRDEPPE